MPEALIIGGSVVDLPLRPVGPEIFSVSSYPVNDITMHLGGDAANEAVILSRLGHRVAIVGKNGADGAGDYIVSELRRAGVDTTALLADPSVDTSINIVLVRENGERSFITNRQSSLRRLSLADIRAGLSALELSRTRIATLASLFVSPALPPADTLTLFRLLHERGLTVCADTTTPKNGETIRDIQPLLSQLDYFFPNQDEAGKLTGLTDPAEIADAFIGCGVRHLALKLGGQGVLLAAGDFRQRIPAYPGAHCIDTTGAGDNFAAAFTAALLEDRSFVDCARFANAAASICVEHLGATTGVYTREDVLRRMAEIPAQA